jgi:hypothetical protein
MTSIKNHKAATALIAISAIAAVLVVSTVAIGSGRMVLADDNVTKNFNNTGINVQTSTSKGVIPVVEALESQVHALLQLRTQLHKAVAF